MDKNSVYKELLKSKVIAKYSHTAAGINYYTVELEAGVYQFPIKLTRQNNLTIVVRDEMDSVLLNETVENLVLSPDLGNTKFDSEIKASELNRWISKAIDNNEFLLILPSRKTLTANLEVVLTKENGKLEVYVDGEKHSSQG